MDSEDLVDFELPFKVCIGIFFSFELGHNELELPKLAIITLMVVVAMFLVHTCVTWRAWRRRRRLLIALRLLWRVSLMMLEVSSSPLVGIIDVHSLTVSVVVL